MFKSCAADPPQPEGAKERLLQVGKRMFASRGQNGVSVRELAREASVNVAAISYYFGSKDGLYAAVIAEVFRDGEEMRSALQKLWTELSPQAGPEELELALQNGIALFMRFLYLQGDPGAASAFMLRESFEPTSELDRVIAASFEPAWHSLTQVLARLAPTLDTEGLGMLAASLVGQCMFYAYNWPLVARTLTWESFGEERVTRVSEHIAKFSLAALRAYRGERVAPPEEASRVVLSTVV